MNNIIEKKFRYDINALRAAAIIGVLLFHYKIPYFSGGFSGVDIFFVISGYLMSKIIINSVGNNKFSLGGFYAKRVKRIVPALLFLIVVITILGFFIYFPVDYQQNEKNLAASNLFISNILYWKNSNYFDPASDTNIFLHTWSLSVEWQFYLVYPLLLLLLNKLIKNKIFYLTIFVALTLTVLLWTIRYTNSHPTPAFYLLPTRSWEMSFGGIAFLIEGKITNKLIRKIVAITGYISIALCFIFLKSEMNWPGAFTILPVFATFMIIISNINDFAILKSRFVQFIGRISYSLYLWHWPLYVIALYIGIKQNMSLVLILICISVIMAYISYKYIESVDLKTSRILLVMGVCLIATSLLSFINTNSVLFKKASLDIADYKKNNTAILDKQFDVGGCFISSKQTGIRDFNKIRCLAIRGDKKNILLIGDSHAADLSASFDEQFQKVNVHLIMATSSGCLPILKNNGENRCRQIINYIYDDFLVKNAKNIKGIIISADWVNATGDNRAELVADINATISYISKFHIKAIIIGQNETYTIPYASIAARESQYNIDIVQNYKNPEAYSLNNWLSKNLSPIYINIYNGAITNGLSPNNVPYMFDSNHYTKYGADMIIKKIFSDKKFQNFIGR